MSSFRISTLEQRTGIPRNTITAWERRYDLLDPSRTDGGYRLYSEADIRTLEQIKVLLEEGYRISEAVSVLREREPEVGTLEGVSTAMETALLAFDRPAADKLKRTLDATPLQELIDRVLLPILKRVGDQWENGTATVAQEHFASAWVRDQIVAHLRSLDPSHNVGPTIVFSGYPGDHHEIGLLAAALRAAQRGFRPLYLGRDLPLSEVPRVATESTAAAVVLSLVIASGPERISRLKRLQIALPHNTDLILGGAAALDLEGKIPGVQVATDLESFERILLKG